MRCKVCDYRLWNLRARDCPECGTPFRPSDYEFAPNSVEFCCPSCGQTYYGTGPGGHLVPRQFNCVQCGQMADMDQMVLRPAPGVEEQATEALHNPWLQRREIGLLRGWLRTVGLALAGPGRLMARTPARSSAGQAIWFALLTNMAYASAAVLPLVLIVTVSTIAAGPGGGNTTAAVFGSLASMGAIVLAGMVITLVGAAVWGLTVHGLLHLGNRPAHGIGRTYQALFYSSGANVLCAIPCLGMYFGGVFVIWWVVSAVLMVQAGQRVSGARASLAVLTLPVLVAILSVGGIAFAIWSTAKAINSMVPTAGGATSMAGTSGLGSAVRQFAAMNGRSPRHGLELVMDAQLVPGDFILADSDTIEEDVPLGSITLADFGGLPLQQQKQVVDGLVRGWEDKVAAHRVGDYVFVYHGIDLRSPPAGLWLVVSYPDPAVNGPPGPNDRLHAALSDGVVMPLPPGSLPQQLQAQNALRQSHRLPPLPHPKDVTRAQPAVAP